ncbi:T-complex protein 11-like protein 2 [Schistosoma japonicum]|nr:T-complex protein 11-like protein 2 [Schistosoma japonicum]
MSSNNNKEEKTASEFDRVFVADTNEPSQSSPLSITMKRNLHDKDKDALLPPSPPKFVSMNQLAEAANAFYNMSLAHEITVDSQFRLEKYEPQEKSLEYCVKETMHRAFWDILRSSLECDPPDYQPVLRLLTEVKQSLKCLVLPNQTTLKTVIENLLDIDVARSQLEETGHLSLEMYKSEVLNLMKQFCAPIRDQEVEDLRKIDDPIDAFRNVFILLDKMHMDLANFTIEQMRPYIRQQAVTYERAKFATFLDAQQKLGIDGLAHTRDWIKQAHDDLFHVSHQSVAECSDTPKGSNSGNNDINSTPVDVKKTSDNCTISSNDTIQLTPNNILREAYLKLLTWPRDRDWPETMLMDQYRLIDLGNQLTIIVNLTSLVLVVCNFIASNASTFTTTAYSSPIVKPILSLPLEGSLPHDAMIQLKKSVCQDVAPILHGITLNYKPDQLVDDIIEHVILTIELWYNRCMEASNTSQLLFNTITPDSSSIISEHKSRIACLTDYGRDQLSLQLTSVIMGEHPVYKLMYKRAMDFLRSALSSYPPEPLPLPSGFSVLLDLDQNKLSSFINNSGTSLNNSVSYLHKPPMNIPTTIMSRSGSCSTTGLHFSPSPSSPRQEAFKTYKFEILSLSDLASRLLPLLAHNRHVFGSYYAEIIQPLLMPTIRK